MIDITIEEIFDRLFNELKTEYKSEELRTETFDGEDFTFCQEVIKKKNLKFTKHKVHNITEYVILANGEVIYSGVYSSEIKDEYNDEEARLLNNLWKNLEESFELRKKESISNNYEKICKALKGE